jgi:hypothetical protein
MKENEGQVLFAVHLADVDPILRGDKSSKGIEMRKKEIWRQRGKLKISVKT